MDPDTLDQLAAELEGYPPEVAPPDLGPYLDALCEALHEVGAVAVQTAYLDHDTFRARDSDPQYEPAGVRAPGALSRLVEAVSDRCVLPPCTNRGGPRNQKEAVRIDPRRRPRARLYRTGVVARVVELSASDDPDLLQIDRALAACAVSLLIVSFGRRADGAAGIGQLMPEPRSARLPEGLEDLIGRWSTAVIERQPLERPVYMARGFLRFEPGSGRATLNHRNVTLVPSDRAVD